MDHNDKVMSLAARLVQPNRNRSAHYESDDDEALFAELEEEIENEGSSVVREHALQAFKQEIERKKQMESSHHGRYTEITDEKEVVHITAHEPCCVVHFYHTDFKRCEIMDKHLSRLAPKYFDTRFFRVFVENIPWLVEKLMIKVLPCVICFVDGVTKDRLVGFEELGNNDAFDTTLLEMRLLSCGVIEKRKSNAHTGLFQVKSSNQHDDDDEIFDL